MVTYDTHISLRVPSELVSKIDSLSGLNNRGEYIRRVLTKHASEASKTPQKANNEVVVMV